MKRRVFGFLLALAMVISLLPPIQLEAKAETVAPETAVATGNAIVDAANKMTFPETGGNVTMLCPVCGVEATWQEMKTPSGVAYCTTAGGHWYLNADLNPTGDTAAIHVTEYSCLHLNGHDVTSAVNAISVVTNGNGSPSTLNLMGNGTLTGVASNEYSSSAIYINGDSTINLYGGTFVSSETASFKSPLIVFGANNYGTVNMYGGTLDGNDVEAVNVPGVLYMANPNCKFNMYGGTIQGGNSATAGGNILHKNGAFNMYGGTITGGQTTKNGGNICVLPVSGASLVFNISGGNITNGVADGSGGNIHLGNIGEVSISNATITGGAANYNVAYTSTNYATTLPTGGGNIFVSAGTTLSITDSTVSGGHAKSNGGNICVAATAGLVLSGNTTVSGGQADRTDGYVSGGGNIFAYAGAIEINDAVQVYGGKSTSGRGTEISSVYTGDVTINGGVIGSVGQTTNSFYLQNANVTNAINLKPAVISDGVIYGTITVTRKTLTIHHGTFSFNPTTYKADGAVVVSGTNYTVHKPVENPASDATCTEHGKFAHIGCSVCKKAFTDATCTEEIDATDATKPAHTQTAVEATPATCTTAGNKAYYACQCGLFYEDEACTKNIADLDAWKAGDGALPVAEHTYVYGYKSATAHTVDCSECDTVFADGEHNTRTGACEFCGAKEIMGAVAAVRDTQYFVKTEENQWFTLGMWGGREPGSKLTFNETVVLKIYSGDELVITTSLKEDGKYGTDGVYVVLKGSQANWETETVALTEDNIPTKVEVYLDDVAEPISTYTLKNDSYNGSIFNQDQYNAYLAFSAVHKHSWDNDCDTQCNGCDKTREPADHNWIAKDAAEATCSAKGNIAYFQCDECDAYAVKDGESYVIKTWAEIETPIAEDNHAYPETWTDAGENHKKVCGNDATHVITEAHSFVYANTGVGTCVCGATTDCEHTYTYTPNNDATCEADGTKHGVCSNCGNEVNVDDAGSKLGHAYPETWTNAGENHKKVCGNDATHVITEAHSFVYANTGVGTCVCGATTDCEHTYTYTPNNDATCEADGTKHGVCSNCGNEVDVDDAGSKLGHAYPETWTNAGENHKKVCGNDATHVITEAHSFVYANTGVGTCVCGATTDCEHTYTYTPNNDATCEADGTKHGVCSNCGNEVNVDDAGSKLGHAYPETWTNAGENHKKVCANNCGKDIVEAHSFVYANTGVGTCVCGATKNCEHTFEYTPNNDATCEADGTKHGVCSNCGNEVDVDDEGSKLGHDYNVNGVYNETQHQLVCGNDDTHITWENHDGNDTCVCGFVAKVYVAQVGDQKFESLTEALESAANGDDLYLLQSIELTERVTIGINMSLYFNGFSITGDFEDAFGMIYVKNGATVAFHDGTISNEGGIAIGNYGYTTVYTDMTVYGADAGLYNFYYQPDYYGIADVAGNVNVIWNCGELSVWDGAVVGELDNSGYAEIDGTVDAIIAQDGTDAPGVEKAGQLAIADTSKITMYEGYELVEVEEGVYKVVESKKAASVNGVQYETLADALKAAAQAGGGIVKLESDVTVDEISVRNNVTLDLNGKKLTVEGYVLAAFENSSIVDNSDDNSGRLVADLEMIRLLDTNAQLPVQMDDGIMFVDAALTQKWYDDEGDYGFWLDVAETDEALVDALKNGSASSCNLKFRVDVKWTQNSLKYTFDDATVDAYAQNWIGLAFYLHVNGAEKVSGLTYQAKVIFAEGTLAQVVYTIDVPMSHPVA